MAGAPDLDRDLQVQARLLGDLLAPGPGRLLDSPDLWRQADGLMEALLVLVNQGSNPTPVADMLGMLPPAQDRRDAVMVCLLRATLLRDGTAPTQALQTVLDDRQQGGGAFSLAQADYILRAVLFGLWINRLHVCDKATHDRVERALWTAILEGYRPALAGRVPVAPADRQRDLVVVLTGQFMRGMHQPSLDTMDFVSKLVLRLGRRVLLVNTADGPVTPHLPFLGGFISGADEGLAKANQLVIDKLPVPFLHLPAGFTDPAMAAATVDHLLAQRPDLVLSFGTMSPVADLCRGLLEVVATPYGSYLPLAIPTYLALPRPLTPADGPALEAGGLTPDRVIPINYTYAPPVAGAARDRAALGVPADAILTLVVGLRLTQEVTPGFVAALDQAVRREPRLFFLFVGPLETYDALMAAHPALAARSRAHGYETDVIGVLKLADLYLNPPRGGGGTSAAYALHCGVPAYGLGWGDVATVIGPDFHLADYDDFAACAARIADDPAWREERQAKAKARFAEISSRQTMLRQILDGVKRIRAAG